MPTKTLKIEARDLRVGDVIVNYGKVVHIDPPERSAVRTHYEFEGCGYWLVSQELTIERTAGVRSRRCARSSQRKQPVYPKRRPTMNGAQVTMIAIMAAGFTLNVALNGQSKGEYSPLISGVAIAIEVAILWWGGFWK